MGRKPKMKIAGTLLLASLITVPCTAASITIVHTQAAYDALIAPSIDDVVVDFDNVVAPTIFGPTGTVAGTSFDPRVTYSSPLNTAGPTSDVGINDFTGLPLTPTGSTLNKIGPAPDLSQTQSPQLLVEYQLPQTDYFATSFIGFDFQANTQITFSNDGQAISFDSVTDIAVNGDVTVTAFPINPLEVGGPGLVFDDQFFGFVMSGGSFDEFLLDGQFFAIDNHNSSLYDPGLSVVPTPAAVWAGLPMLGGLLSVTRLIRRRRA